MVAIGVDYASGSAMDEKQVVAVGMMEKESRKSSCCEWPDFYGRRGGVVGRLVDASEGSGANEGRDRKDSFL